MVSKSKVIVETLNLFYKTHLTSDKMWPTGEENGKSLQYSYLENAMSSIKGKKIGH